MIAGEWVVEPYGVSVVDCALAERIAQDYSGRRATIIVGDCDVPRSVGGVGFVCDEELVGAAGDEEQSHVVTGVVFSKGLFDRPCYQCSLLSKGAAVVAPYCLDKSLPGSDYCNVLKRVIQKK